jgi:broad specificity phosphatase PhoE
MIIRHGEKPDDKATGAAAKGVDANGVADDSSLTTVGWDRAHRLVDLFDPAGGAVRPGLARPATIYAAGANDEGEGKRTRETVTPLAEKLGLTVNTAYGKGDEEKLVEHVLTQPGPTLISWQHGEIPSMAEAFPGVSPAPPSEWPDDRFDVVWILTKTDTGWHFAQLPELVLPQDQAAVLAEDD